MEIRNILQGISNSLLNEIGFPNEKVESIAEDRYKICKKCPSFVWSPAKSFHCDDCGCILKLKVRSDSKCPKDKWKKLIIEN